MTVEDFMESYRDSFENKPLFNPLSRKTKKGTAKKPQFGFQDSPAPRLIPQRDDSSNLYGNAMGEYLQGEKKETFREHNRYKQESTADLAKDVVDKSVGHVPTNEYGVVQDNGTNFQKYFDNRLKTVGEIGDIAVETSAAKARWQRLQSLKELNAGVVANIAPGSSGKGGASKAVALALTAAKRGTPYVWGGNSLTGGVDCSGLVQQVYRRMGINLPRTTYEQAKHGKRVGLGNLLPGDLVFYNTGSRDPNGIGRLSHVAIYIGNGQVVQALNSKTGVITSSINRAGNPALGIRPW